MHQECYGANDVQDYTSWVCRACETPDVEKQCCLCPVKGMLLNYVLTVLSGTVLLSNDVL